jgi:hypothetical protein
LKTFRVSSRVSASSLQPQAGVFVGRDRETADRVFGTFGALGCEKNAFFGESPSIHLKNHTSVMLSGVPTERNV